MRRRHGYRHATRDGLGSTRVSCREAAAPHTEGRKCKMVMCQSKLLPQVQRGKNKTKEGAEKSSKMYSYLSHNGHKSPNAPKFLGGRRPTRRWNCSSEGLESMPAT